MHPLKPLTFFFLATLLCLGPAMIPQPANAGILECGDGACSPATEDCQNCPDDCGPCPECGDGICDPMEDDETCFADCCTPGGTCNNHGTCDPEGCLCDEGYDGPNCGTCATGYFGYPDCTSCDPAITCNSNGTCEPDGSCLCDPGFTGENCELFNCAALDCNDGNPCTEDLCSAIDGCLNTPIPIVGAPCEDGNVCNGSETCVGDVCTAGEPLNCDDGNPCTLNDCGEPGGCFNTPIPDCVIPCALPTGDNNCFTKPASGPGCDDEICEAIVCAADPFCCATNWDSICNGLANDLCTKCCVADEDCEPGESCDPDGQCVVSECGDGLCDPATEDCLSCEPDCGPCLVPCEQSAFPECGGACPAGTSCNEDPSDSPACVCVPDCAPSGPEVCDGVDNNCDGVVDNAPIDGQLTCSSDYVVGVAAINRSEFYICNGALPEPQIGPEAVFEFTAQQTGPVLLEMQSPCGLPLTAYVLETHCSPDSCVAYNGLAGPLITVDFFAEQGQSYFIYVESVFDDGCPIELSVLPGTPGCPEDCDNGLDDDADGATDCLDIDCVGDPACCIAPDSNCLVEDLYRLGCDSAGCEAVVCELEPLCCPDNNGPLATVIPGGWALPCAELASDWCPVCVAECGDGVCDPATEDCQDCPADCGPCPVPCEQSAFPACGGDCPAGTSCTTNPSGVAECVCLPDCTPPTSTCFEIREDPGCDDPTCQATVCGADPYCCDVGWDDQCAAAADTLCPVCVADCGNGVCDPATEECQSCPADCGPCPVPCEQSAYPECGGDCPAGTSCTTDLGVGACLCQPDCVPEPEICDGVDNDCDNAVDELVVPATLGAPLAIPDNDPAGITDTIVVTADFTISDLNVGLVVDHTWVGDLCITLEHDGVTVQLVARPGGDNGVESCYSGSPIGCSQDNYDVVLDDEGTGGPIEDLCSPTMTSPPNYIPLEPLGAFDTMNAAGTWTIKVADRIGVDTGALVAWSLQFQDGICAPDCVPEPEICDGLDNDCDGIVDNPIGVNNGTPTLCDDGDLCTIDSCNSELGVCEFEPVDCAYLDNQCNTGECDSMTGQCQALPQPEGTPCEDGDFCTSFSGDPGAPDGCDGLGACVGVPVDCSDLDDECNTGECDSMTGECQAIPGPDGTFCTTAPDIPGDCQTPGCQAGVCISARNPEPDSTICTTTPDIPGDCQTPGCEAGQCVAAHNPEPDSTPCIDDDGDGCTDAGCEVGICVQTHVQIPCGADGCTPGYWKANADKKEANAWAPADPTAQVHSVFTLPNDCDGADLDAMWGGLTLREALSLRGGSGVKGASQILLRIGTGAYLNAVNLCVRYDAQYASEAALVNAVNAALASCDRQTMLSLASELDFLNNAGCPLNQVGECAHDLE